MKLIHLLETSPEQMEDLFDIQGKLIDILPHNYQVDIHEVTISGEVRHACIVKPKNSKLYFIVHRSSSLSSSKNSFLVYACVHSTGEFDRDTKHEMHTDAHKAEYDDIDNRILNDIIDFNNDYL